jgi:hypothetical protein
MGVAFCTKLAGLAESLLTVVAVSGEPVARANTTATVVQADNMGQSSVRAGVFIGKAGKLSVVN